MKNIIKKPTRYFSPIGIIIVPYDPDFEHYEFYDVNNRKTVSYIEEIDIERDDLTVAACRYGEMLFNNIHQQYLKQNLELYYQDPINVDRLVKDTISEKNRAQFFNFLCLHKTRYVDDLYTLKINGKSQ